MTRLDISTCATVVELLYERVRQTPGDPAFWTSATPEGPWLPIHWRSHCEQIERLANAFICLGLAPGDRLAIMAPTSLAWEQVQMAALHAGACVVGVDMNYTDEQLACVLPPLKLAAVVGGDAATLRRIPGAVRSRLKFQACIEHIHNAGAEKNIGEGLRQGSVDAGFSLAQLMQNFHAKPTNLSNACSAGGGTGTWSGPGADDEALIVFSSGTTGMPKAIAYRHGQLMQALATLMGCFAEFAPNSRLICWLPLANIFQRMVNFTAMACGASSYLLANPLHVMSALPVANPHLFVGVPRFFEKVHAAVCASMQAQGGLRAKAVQWAIALGHARAQALRNAQQPRLSVRLLWLCADRLVLRTIRRAFGADLRYCISGSAAMSPALLQWFEAIGLPVLQAYGISENIIPMALNRMDAHPLGSVGKPLAPNHIRVAEDGEILVRGPGVFTGYLDADGVLCGVDRSDGFHATGDLGRIDAQGYLHLLGRKSDVFKTSTGKWVNPASIEQRLKTLPYVKDALVCGANRKAVVALIFQAHNSATPQDGEPMPEPADSPAQRQAGAVLARDLERILADLPPYQHPAGAIIIAHELSVQGGEITANLKLRRRFIESKYMRHIERVYAGLQSQRCLDANMRYGQARLVVEYI